MRACVSEQRAAVWLRDATVHGGDVNHFQRSMATYKAPRNISRRQELREDAVTTVWVRVQELYYEYQRLVYGIGIGVAVLLLGYFGYGYLQGMRADQAEEFLGGIILVYEAGEYQTALDGTATAPGLVEIVEDYGSTPSGNLARFYAADAAFRLGDYDRAFDYFRSFEGGDDMIAASALAGQAAVYEINEEYARGGDLFRRAASIVEDDLNSPGYLMAAGRAYEKAGDFEEAVDAYERIREEYPESTQAQDIDFVLARARAGMQ